MCIGGVDYLPLSGTQRAERECFHLAVEILFISDQIMYLAWEFGCANFRGCDQEETLEGQLPVPTVTMEAGYPCSGFFP